MQDPCKYNILYSYVCIYTHILLLLYCCNTAWWLYNVDAKRLGGASVQLLAAYLLSSLFGISISAIYEVIENMA